MYLAHASMFQTNFGLLISIFLNICASPKSGIMGASGAYLGSLSNRYMYLNMAYSSSIGWNSFDIRIYSTKVRLIFVENLE